MAQLVWKECNIFQIKHRSYTVLREVFGAGSFLSFLSAFKHLYTYLIVTGRDLDPWMCLGLQDNLQDLLLLPYWPRWPPTHLTSHPILLTYLPDPPYLTYLPDKLTCTTYLTCQLDMSNVYCQPVMVLSIRWLSSFLWNKICICWSGTV